MKVYKILHKPTGLYFTPSKGNGNLSMTGKIYSRKPSLTVCIGGGIRVIIHQWNDKPLSAWRQKIVDFFDIKLPETGCRWFDKNLNSPYEDWEIVEF